LKKNLVLTASFVVASLFFNGCNNDEKEKFELSDSESKTYLLNKQNGELFFIDNKTMYKVVTETETKNKIGEILNLEGVFAYSKMQMKSKVYNDSIYYKIDLHYLPIIEEIVDPSNPANKIKKDVSKISFEEWKKAIASNDKNYSISLVFLDEDGFTVTTKTILLRNLTVNFDNGITYEGSFTIDKSIATKINKLNYYYYYPDFNTNINNIK
jgi:hypothetical protein